MLISTVEESTCVYSLLEDDYEADELREITEIAGIFEKKTDNYIWTRI